MKTLLPFLLFFLSINCFSQNGFPYERPLKISWSNDGIIFNNTTIFQDSSGVPSVIRWKGDTLACVFQWFRLPKNSPSWDRVAVKFSYNAGQTWTEPTPIIINGLPTKYQRPFDPTLAVISNDSLRIYFSSSDGMPIGGLDSLVNTYSAASTDGITYSFEPNARFDQPSKPVIDPAVIYFNGMWHYSAPAGPPQDGTYHATSKDGLNFTYQGKYSSDNQHNWTGNFMQNSPTELRFYGAGQTIWYNSSIDGTIWQGYVNTNLTGGDPSITTLPGNRYVAIYVGEPYNSGKNFVCGDSLIDTRDGKRYSTVLIGKDCWMKQNLDFGQFVRSDSASTIHSDMHDNGIYEKYVINNDVTKALVYGGLYEWNELMNYTAANGSQGLCPAGWHVSTDEEWQSLITISGGRLLNSTSGNGGNALKNTGEGFGAGSGTNTVGFSAKHSGDRDAFGIFYGLTLRSIFWTSTQANSIEAYHYTLWASNDTIQRLALGSNTGFACRCVQNAPTGVNENHEKNNQPLVYPNPFIRTINVQANNDSYYELVNSLGLTIWSGKHIELRDFSELVSGTYFLKVNNQLSFEVFKLLKE
ncbi:MAG: T9SS type A sorting domain-containing protein [Ignavibacteriae bacterium]|nr:T9SS type A sorting domain-containing protein [Ignavibacteriota bacterium]